MSSLVVKKVLNNNVLIATHDMYDEVVLIGKGIGFQRTKGEVLTEHAVEKMFVLKDPTKQEQYKNLLPEIDEKTFDTIVEAFELIRKETNSYLNEHVLVALTDHIIFSVQRFIKGITIKNPFLIETKTLYPKEFEIAKKVVDIVKRATNLNLPDDEISFITLHIHSVLSDKNLSEINFHSRLIGELILLIESEMDIRLDKESIDYMRLIRHLLFTVERINRGETLLDSPKITLLLQNEYPFCYNLSWKLIKVMQNSLKKPVENAEAIYLTMHLQRLMNKN